MPLKRSVSKDCVSPPSVPRPPRVSATITSPETFPAAEMEQFFPRGLAKPVHSQRGEADEDGAVLGGKRAGIISRTKVYIPEEKGREIQEEGDERVGKEEIAEAEKLLGRLDQAKHRPRRVSEISVKGERKGSEIAMKGGRKESQIPSSSRSPPAIQSGVGPVPITAAAAASSPSAGTAAKVATATAASTSTTSISTTVTAPLIVPPPRQHPLNPTSQPEQQLELPAIDTRRSVRLLPRLPSGTPTPPPSLPITAPTAAPKKPTRAQKKKDKKAARKPLAPTIKTGRVLLAPVSERRLMRKAKRLEQRLEKERLEGDGGRD